MGVAPAAWREAHPMSEILAGLDGVLQIILIVLAVVAIFLITVKSKPWG